jgi:fatty-acyl-CoA synthase
VVYTSGTTGRPKGAARDYTSYGLVELSRVLERLPLRVGERHLMVAPLYHSGGQAFALLESALGATLYLRKHFDAEDALRSLSAFGIESVFLVPTLIQRLLELPEPFWARWPVPRLRAVISGAAPFPQALRERAMARFGAQAVYDFYGATELGWVTLARGDEMLERPGTVGRPLPGQQVRIRGERGEELPASAIGTIWVRNEQTMEGYLNEAQADTDARRDGWVTVDDLGRMDDDGYLYLAGRARDMVISGGVNIYPAEIEDVLARHAGVREAAVVGVPDEDWGERLVAVVALFDLDLETAELERHAREHLASFKVPRQWEVVEELPRNPTGKVLKGTLREMLAG